MPHFTACLALFCAPWVTPAIGHSALAMLHTAQVGRRSCVMAAHQTLRLQALHFSLSADIFSDCLLAILGRQICAPVSLLAQGKMLRQQVMCGCLPAADICTVAKLQSRRMELWSAMLAMVGVMYRCSSPAARGPLPLTSRQSRGEAMSIALQLCLADCPW